MDENDHLIELNYRYRGYGIGGFAAWALVILVAFRLSQFLGLLQRSD